MIRTSLNYPLYLDELDLRVAPRFAHFTSPPLGLTILPGKHQIGISGRHERDLELDAARLTELGVSVFVLLVEDHELIGCAVPNFVEVMHRHHITVLRCPIVDGQTPGPTSLAAFRALLAEMEARLRAGQHLAVSCRGGLGRTGLTAACLLINGGLDSRQAISLVRQVRSGAIENRLQEYFIRSWPIIRGD